MTPVQYHWSNDDMFIASVYIKPFTTMIILVYRYSNIVNTQQTRYVTGFAKRGLMHASNLSTLKICDSAYVRPIAFKFGKLSFLSLYLFEIKFQLNILFTKEVMLRQSCIIGCVYKTPFRKSGHILCWIVLFIEHTMVYLSTQVQ